MPASRPRIKKYRKTKVHRCPKCGKVMHMHTRRCKTCHQVQPKYL